MRSGEWRAQRVHGAGWGLVIGGGKGPRYIERGAVPSMEMRSEVATIPPLRLAKGASLRSGQLGADAMEFVPLWNGWLDLGRGYPPCFLVCVGKKGVTGEWLVCRGTKGLSAFCDGEQGLAGEFVGLFVMRARCEALYTFRGRLMWEGRGSCGN